ncbi:uncharacterized protein isoform X4 [Salmo salar]|uniref:Uncharacterized protein isoform X4 n=1 Tax=Salmo salar TaxID=8030 RepID=A0A1S3T6Y9_SALSA|nr:uncharacterized protein LOC106613978 isoform X4 [Salmo salar]
MEPQDRPQPGTMPRINRVRPGKGDVKVSVVNMCGPSSSTILRKIYQQTALSINSTRTSRGTEPTTPTTVASSVYSGGLQSDGGTASRNTTALSAPQNNKNTPVSL